MDIWCILGLFVLFHDHLVGWLRTLCLVMLCCHQRLPVRLFSRMQTMLSQHTPVILERHCRWINLDIKNTIMELVEECSLKRLGAIIPKHLGRGTIFKFDFPTVYPIGHKVISNINVSCAFTTGCSAVLLKEDSTIIILINDTIIDVVSLGFKKVACPQYL